MSDGDATDEFPMLDLPQHIDRIAPIVNGRPTLPAAKQPKDRFPLVTCAALDSGDYTPRWIIDDMLAAGSPAVCGGIFKSMKTLIAMDAAISVASGMKFLGRFAVQEPLSAVYFIGEGGPSVTQEYCRRIAESKGLRLADVSNLRLSFAVPKLESLPDLDAVQRIHDETAAELMTFDNLMLCMSADEPGNVFRMGQTLSHVIRICGERGITPIFVHHFKRTRATANQNDPGELLDLTQAGAAEIAGQWWLLTRRSAYHPDRPGEHELWMTAGGRIGHSSLHALNIHEGTRKDPGGRRWDVDILSAGDVRESEYRRTEAVKAAESETKQDARTEADAKRIVQVMVKLKADDTGKAIRERAGLSGTRFTTAMASLLESGVVVPAEIVRPNRKTPYDGYTLREGDGDT